MQWHRTEDFGTEMVGRVDGYQYALVAVNPQRGNTRFNHILVHGPNGYVGAVHTPGATEAAMQEACATLPRAGATLAAMQEACAVGGTAGATIAAAHAAVALAYHPA